MELSDSYSVFFTLLRSGLWKKVPECSCFPLGGEAWEQVYTLARKQTVEGIVYDGIVQLPHECLPQKNLLLKWTALVNALENRNKRMNGVVEELGRLFANNHIPFLLLKGQGIAACYDEPLHRVCGDVDWFFPGRKAFDQANQLIRDQGGRVNEQTGFSVAYEWRGFLIEHHSRLLDIHNPFHLPYLDRLQQEEYEDYVCLELKGQKIGLPSPLLAHLSVNSHILKHMLSFGVGIRQLCDSARICYTYQEKTDGALLKEIYCKVGIYRWVQALNCLLVKDLGMPEACLPFPLSLSASTGGMMNEMLRGGNFGFYDERFGPDCQEPWVKREHAFRHIIRRFGRNVCSVPSEACWFPVIQAYSRIRNYMTR